MNPDIVSKGEPQISAAAAGLGFDVEYVQPQKHRDPGSETQIYFPVKFVCGEATIDDPLVPANYSTIINILNLSKFKVDIGWHFVTLSQTITGPRLEIPAHGYVRLDCEYIVANLVNAGVDVDSFIEGFILIEDLQKEPVIRVAAVYSALHKQLHELPDLVPVETASGFCRLDADGRLIVTIKNQGEQPAALSMTRIVIGDAGPVDRPTPALAPGQQVDLAPIEFPSREEGRFPFTIEADIQGVIQESNEFNNTVHGFCIFIH